MSKADETLDDLTFKDAQGVARRVYYTMTSDADSRLHRTAKTLALLIEKLLESGLLTDEDLDRMLSDAVS